MKPDWLTLRMYRIDTIMKRYVDEIEFVAGLIALSMFLLMLGGCGAVSRVVILQNPATKQTVECKEGLRQGLRAGRLRCRRGQ